MPGMEVAISKTMLLVIVLAPLLGAIVAGFFGRQVGRAGSHTVTILGVAASFALSAWVLYQLVGQGAAPSPTSWYRMYDDSAQAAATPRIVTVCAPARPTWRPKKPATIAPSSGASTMTSSIVLEMATSIPGICISPSASRFRRR